MTPVVRSIWRPSGYAIFLVTAPDRNAAIKKATERYDIQETSELLLDVVLLTPPKLKRIKVRGGLR
jgi:hypothetical protein